MSRKKKFTIQNKMNDRAMTDKKGNANGQHKGIGQGIHVVAKPIGPVYIQSELRVRFAGQEW